MALPNVIDSPIYKFECKSSKKAIEHVATKFSHEKIFGIAMENAKAEDDKEKSKEIVNDAMRQVLSDCLVNEKIENLSFVEIEEFWLNLRAVSSMRELSIIYKAAESCVEQGHQKQNMCMVDTLEYNISSQSGKSLDDIAAKYNMEKKKEGYALKLTPNIGVTLAVPKDIIGNNNLLSKCIVNVFDENTVYEEYSEEELNDFIGKFPNKTITPIKQFVDSLPTVAMEIKIVCPDCGHTRTTKLKGLDDFFG